MKPSSPAQKIAEQSHGDSPPLIYRLSGVGNTCEADGRMKTFPDKSCLLLFPLCSFIGATRAEVWLVGRRGAFTVMFRASSPRHDREREGFQFVFISQSACMAPRCSGLKKQKADASVIKTIKPAAAPSAIVRDRSNEWRKESRREFEKVATCR